MDATSANNILNATAKTIINLLWGEVQYGEWAIAVGRMDNAMHAAHAVIQHTDIIPGILIAVEQLLHLEAAVWPNWMGMIQWTQELVACHPWAQQGTIVRTEYKFGDSSTNDNKVSQPLKEPMGAEEEEAQGAQILQMKIEEDDEEDVAYRRQQKEHVKGKKRADATEGESSLGKRKADKALEDATECGRTRMRGSSSKMTAAQPTLVHLPGGRMTTAKKAARPKWMTKAQRAAEHRDDVKSKDEDPIGNVVVGSTSSADRMMATPTPAPQSTPPWTPIPVPNPANRCSPDQRMCSHSEEHLPDLEHHLRLQLQDCDVLHVPLHLCGDTRQHPATCKSPRLSQQGIQQYGNYTAHPTFASHSMESTPKTSAVKAPVNMGLIAGTAYSFGGNPLVSHEEHHAALQQLETVEVENHELCGLITICEATRRSVATSPTDVDRADVGFPFKRERSTAASHQELGPAQPSHSPSPSLSSNTVGIPSAVNLGMRWHIGPAIV
ncbi:hypothetical protein PAXRUDRAFT_18244 [Paxillus rubicundulus Ve08.2h10]|uniref:Uncharacterized protein n=1 Tax=Paxillus rubicundulus Ve08.2h10 TaxID=930991 RepID=A0A0D0CMB4_9AGAM|nr:hypothetical protein PAXRUDRAFT_18244 [Paxillus rubicundulus Ve08.2h10]